MRLKKKDIRMIQEMKNFDKSKLESLMRKIPAKFLMKFFVNIGSKDQLKQIYDELVRNNEVHKIEFLVKSYKRKYRINPKFVDDKYL